MPVITREKLWDKLKQGAVAPVYLLFGPETFLRDRAVKFIADRTFTDSDLRDFNETEFSLNHPDDLRAALGAAEQLPMMSARRVIRITDVRISSSGRLDTIKDEHEALLSNFLERPPAHAVVVFVADELNGSRRISRLLKESCTAVDFVRLDAAERSKFAIRHIGEMGSEIGDDALQHLIRTVGADIRRLTNEIEKLSTSALPGKEITVELIDELVSNTGEIGQWDFVNQMASRRMDKAVVTLRKMFDDGADPLMVLGQIAGSYRRSAIDGKATPAETARRMKKLAETDLAIKSSIGGGGPAGARMLLEKLACELALI